MGYINPPHVIAGKWTDDQTAACRIDSASDVLEIIDYPHHEIHAGSMYHAYATSSNIGAETGDHLQLSFTTPNTTKWMHLVADAECSAAFEYTMREGSTAGSTLVAAVSTTFVPHNRNRNSTAVSGVATVLIAGSAGLGGTLLASEFAGAGKKLGGASRDIDEWVLKQNTRYDFRVFSANANPAILSLHWYEHTNRH